MGLHEQEQQNDIVADMENDVKEEVDDEDVELPSALAFLKKERPPYASNVRGRPIRHSRTGAYYDEHLVGSRNECRYFKVIDARKSNAQGCCNVFFYDSPSDYERYGGKVHDDVARHWLSRRQQYFGY